MQKEFVQENFRDKILAMLPEERRLDMMMVINDAGLFLFKVGFVAFILPVKQLVNRRKCCLVDSVLG